MRRRVSRKIIAGLICLVTLWAGSALASEDYYLIGPSDLIEVIVWREDAITRNDLLVRPDGRISLPLADDIMAGGLTPMELKKEITNALSQFVAAPQVYIIIKDPRSHYCAILGEVNKPGQHPMLTPTNVLQAIAKAEGFNEWAHKDDIVIIRGSGPDTRIFPFNYEEVIEGKKTEQNIILEPGDVVVVR